MVNTANDRPVITKQVSFDFDLCDLIATATPAETASCYEGREGELVQAIRNRVGDEQFRIIMAKLGYIRKEA
ncbi:hypothetical protein [Methanocella sp. MCL-LM]|uniref:hypothetical protein n=1 Tax=Methanocella sp. MCL-LM TaxID=3412035 RepID=UPI003C741805